MRIGSAGFLYLVPNFANGCGQLLSRTFAADVHEIDLRLVVEKVVVQRSDGKAVVQRRAHHGIHFILKKHGVAHDHDAAHLCFCESRPRSQSHEWRHGPAVHDYLHIVARRGDLKDTFSGAPCTLDPGDLFDAVRVECRVRCERQGGGDGE